MEEEKFFTPSPATPPALISKELSSSTSCGGGEVEKAPAKPDFLRRAVEVTLGLHPELAPAMVRGDSRAFYTGGAHSERVKAEAAEAERYAALEKLLFPRCGN